MDAMKDLKWLIVIVVAIGIIWIISGGPAKSFTKNSPVIQPVSGEKASSTGGWFGFLFPSLGGSNRISTNNVAQPRSVGTSTGSKATQSSASYGSPNPKNTTSTSGGSTKTLYGADEPPGPIINEPDKITISSISRSSDQYGKSDNEYVLLSTPSTNKKPILITGMLLKSRMTGNQADIRKGTAVYYANSVNSEDSININPGETAYIITGRSPIGYSFKINKCIGYLKNHNQNFIAPLSSSCPKVTDYPLPARPNQFNDTCLDFLNKIGVCKEVTKFPDNLQQSCKTFAAERANYSRCVTDFGNDLNFLGKQWLVYLNRDDALWKTKREIVDLVDQQGNVVSTYTY